jgi:glycosyltransferase involved in cell wall biosynthesis
VEISTACPTGCLYKRLTTLGVGTYKILPPPRKFNTVFTWLLYLFFINLQVVLVVFKVRPQIIHANSSKAVLAAAMAKVLIGAKLIWHARDLKCSRLLTRLCGLLSTKVIAVSKAVKDELISLGIKPELIEVVYNGVYLDDLLEKINRKNHNNLYVFANIGQFVPWKKQLLFIKAAERFLRDGHEIQFLLIGDDIFGRDGRYKKQLVERIKVSHFSTKIKIIDWQDDLDSYWPDIDCLIHTADAEPFGRVIIEAMMHGVPVIAAASGGPAEIITNGKTGLLFRPDDIRDLLRAMKIISENRELAYNLAENARQHIISNFQAKKTGERITKIYEELLAA